VLFRSTAQTTLFTIVNTTRVPQIAAITIWTDLGYPVLTLNAFLTGYDVQAFNLYDILARGFFGDQLSNNRPPGSRSAANGSNPNFLPNAADRCANVPATLPGSILRDVQLALTTGEHRACGTTGLRVGTAHENAAGYVTIDVAATCSFDSPLDATYFDELLYDNVLTGDYERISPNPVTGNYAGGNPLVHIRAVPEGGAAGVVAETGLPYTFYDRYTPAARRRIDRRQPLPSTFVARFIQGGATAFQTDLQIWREGSNAPVLSCPSYAENNMPVTDVVRFDERENPTMLVPIMILPAPPRPTLPATYRLSTTSTFFPPLTSGDVGGWFYLNLNNGGSNNYSAAAGRDFTTGSSTTVGPRQNQNWVSISMYAEGRYSVMLDATLLANGCTPAPRVSTQFAPIGPGPNDTP
jgi:hypothetical protein